jgi:hypothetical protein
VVVPAATRALDGTTLGADRAFGFATPRPALLAASVPDGFVAGRGYPLRLFFQPAVCPGGKPAGCSRSADTRGAPRADPVHGRARTTSVTTGWRRISACSAPDPDGVGDVVVEGGSRAPRRRGHRVSLAPARAFPLPTLGPLRFTVECERAPDGRCAADSCPTLTLSKPVPHPRALPAPPLRAGGPEGPLRVRGQHRLHPTRLPLRARSWRGYRVEVRPGFVTEDGGERHHPRPAFRARDGRRDTGGRWTRSARS